MNTDQLACFVSLSNTLNYMKTADQLGLTQPAVTKQIQALERELGAALFYRTTRSVSLTQIGQEFLNDATTMLNTYYRSKEWISGVHRSSRHILRIGYSDPNNIPGISAVLKRLTEDGETITPELLCDQTDANLSRLSSGRLELVIGMKDARFSDDQVIFHKLREERFYCVLARSHPLAVALAADEHFCGEIDSETLWPYRQIISIPPYLMKSSFSRGHHILPVNESAENIICDNTAEACGMVLAGIGYSMIPGYLVTQHPELLVWKWKETPHAPFGIYRSKAASKDAAASRFIKLAEEIYR